MSRIGFRNLDELDPVVLSELQTRLPLQVYGAIAHSEPALKGFLAMGNELGQHRLTKRIREIIVLRMASLLECGYELHQHRKFAEFVGLTKEEICLIEEGIDSALLNPEERAVLQMVSELTVGNVSEKTYKIVAHYFDNQQMVEIVFIFGYYQLLEKFIETFQIEPESDGVISKEAYAKRVNKWKKD